MPRKFLFGPLKNVKYIIRLHKKGCNNRPFHHIVVAKYPSVTGYGEVEQLGTVDAMPNQYGEVMCGIDYDRLSEWLLKSDVHVDKSAGEVFGLSGFLPMHPVALAFRKIQKRKSLDDYEYIGSGVPSSSLPIENDSKST